VRGTLIPHTAHRVTNRDAVVVGAAVVNIGIVRAQDPVPGKTGVFTCRRTPPVTVVGADSRVIHGAECS